MRERFNKILLYFMILSPFIDIITAYQVRYSILPITIGAISRTVIMLIAGIWLIVNKKYLKYLIALIIFAGISLFYYFTNGFSILSELSNLLIIYYVLIMIMYFIENKNIINKKTLFIIYSIYLNCLIIPWILGIGHNINEIYPNKYGYIGFYYGGNEIGDILVCLLPIILDYLIKLKNYFTKIIFAIEYIAAIILIGTKTLLIGTFIVVIYYLIKSFKKFNRKIKIITCECLLIGIVSIIVILPHTSLYNNICESLNYSNVNNINDIFNYRTINNLIFSERLTFLYNKHVLFSSSNILTKLFGLNIKLCSKDIEMDIFDIFYSIGIVGFVLYLFIFIKLLFKNKYNGEVKLSLILFLLISTLSGHILLQPMVSIFIAILMNLDNDDNCKSILLISNMYPSKKYKHYGIFVKNTYNLLVNNNYKVDKVIMYKHTNSLIKLIDYIRFHLVVIIKCMFVNYDYLYVHFISHSSLGAVVSKIISKDLVLVFNAHGNDVISNDKNIKRSKFYLNYANKVVVPSLYFKNLIHDMYQVDLNNIYVYPSGGVDTSLFKHIDIKKAKLNSNINVNDNYIGYVSRIEPGKGYDIFLEFASYLKKHKYNYKFLIVGSGSDYSKMIDLINKYNLNNDVILKDMVNQKELVNIYNSLDVFIFPSTLNESLGLVGLEAMSCSIPVLIGNNKGPSEYLVDKVNGLYFEEGNYKSLINAFKEYLKMDKKQINNMVKCARKMALKYDKKNISYKILEVFK